MQIIYKCACMAVEAKVEVRERLDYEDVIAWANNIAKPALRADHARRSPHCPYVGQKFTTHMRPLIP
jgi:hypothetical protein